MMCGVLRIFVATLCVAVCMFSAPNRIEASDISVDRSRGRAAPRGSSSVGMSGGVGSESRAVVALVRIVATPYWQHLHRRIDREMPEVELHCLYSWNEGDQPWKLTDPDVRPVSFAVPGEVDNDQPVRSAWSDWRKAGRKIDWLREHGVRAVVVSGYNRLGALRIAGWCKWNDIPCFVTGDANVHADRATGWKRFAKTLVVRWMLRQCDGALPFGTAGRRFFENYGADPKRIFLFPGEPDYSRIEALTEPEIQAAASAHGLKSDRRRIVFCGRLIRVKRVDLLIDAFVKIASDRPEWDLVIIGDGPLKRELQARVPVGLESRVRWTGFIADQNRVAGIYRSCDVLALPSDHEPWALVVNEAAAAGLALVTSDVVGAAEDLVRPGVNGATFARGDVTDLAKALESVTAADKIDTLKSGSSAVLAEWRRSADPVKGLRNALQSVGVIA